MPPTESLDSLNFDKEEKITTQEPTGAESSDLMTNFWESDVSGEITTRDKKFPRLNIGQKSGNIGEEKGLGSLVLNREIVLLPPLKPGENKGVTLPGVIVLKIQKLYQEKREYDPSSTTLPRTWNTAKEAVAAGFSTTWGDGEKIAVPVALMLLLIPAPEGLDQESIEQNFSYSYDGTSYLAAGFFAAGTSWHEAAKPIFTALDTPKVKELGLRAIRWNLRVIRRTGAKGAWFAMSLATGGFNQIEFVNFTKELLP